MRRLAVKPKARPSYPSYKPPEKWKTPALIAKDGRVIPRSPGRPRKTLEALRVDANMIERMARKGAPITEIAYFIGISFPTLKKCFEEDPSLAEAYGRGKAQLAQLYRTYFIKNMDKSPALAIFGAKNLAGFSDSPKEVRHVGADGGPIVYRTEFARAAVAEILDGEIVDDDDEEDEE